jgi:hypothetical protein
MGIVSFDIRGDKPPFNVCLVSGSTILQSFSGMSASGTTGFTGVNVGSYNIVVEDLIKNTCSVPFNPTTTTTTTSTTTTVPPTTTTTTTLAPTTTTTSTTTSTSTTTTQFGDTVPITYSCSYVGIDGETHEYDNIVDYEIKTGSGAACLIPNTSVPNKVEIRKYSDNSLVTGSTWVGEACYVGPWGIACPAAPYSCCPSGIQIGWTVDEQHYCIKVCTLLGCGFSDAYTLCICDPL